jgi:cardiolipin synthase C
MYYIWREDTSGTILIDELLRAADRGVRVRILLDALNFVGSKSLFIGLNHHPNIEVRLFNPFRIGFLNGVFKIFEFLSRASLLNRRMHNKCWIVDGQIAICGGRNIGDEYFGNKKTANFADLDVGLTGDIAKIFLKCFEDYWGSSLVKKITKVRGLETSEDFLKFRERIVSLRAVADATEFAKILENQKTPHEEADNFIIAQQDILVVWDPPERKRLKENETQTTANEVFKLITSAKKAALVVSPYFVPGPRGSQALQIAASQKNHKIKILTNSLAATDAVAAHSGVIKYRERLLRAGVEIFELKPTFILRQRLGLLPKSRASLHAKTIVVDLKRAYIGSFNLDPRSALLNCEMGVIIQHEPLAREVHRIYKEATEPHNSWQLKYSEKNDLIWIGRTEKGEEEIYFNEPQVSRTKRFAAWFFSCLPIEPLL